MSTLLQSLVKTVEKFPVKKQEFIVHLVLEEMESEELWDQCFSETTEEKFKKLVQKVKAEKTISMGKF